MGAHILMCMESQGDRLIDQVRNILSSLSDLPENELRDAVMEVLRLNAPFHHTSALEEIFRESINPADEEPNKKDGPEPVLTTH